jgi:hypothetical protein
MALHPRLQASSLEARARVIATQAKVIKMLASQGKASPRVRLEAEAVAEPTILVQPTNQHGMSNQIEVVLFCNGRHVPNNL